MDQPGFWFGWQIGFTMGTAATIASYCAGRLCGRWDYYRRHKDK